MPDSKSKPMTTDAAARIQSTEARNSGTGQVQSGGFASRAQGAAATNINQGTTQHQGGKK
ncbi:putative uncharacterized protein DDB_G0289245 [Convolutriloba macropyga]|uniref:putative uncharacterized protein DDB_G0289245 n=1 Tax=Convolutriloba macropyga TaxID=536237 RepID=UPI003F52900A